MTQQNLTQSNKKFLVIGAGVSGLYTAWRLLHDDIGRQVTIIDRLNRTGGRLDSDIVRIPDKYDKGHVHVKEEEGGMRFEQTMFSLMSLFTAMDLCDDAVYFPMNTNRFSLREHSFTYEESLANNNAIWGQLYDLAPAEQNQSPGTLLGVIYQRIVNANGLAEPPANPTAEYWEKFRLEFKWDGETLNKWQLGGLLSSMGYSDECITMIADSVGFRGPFQGLPNAGEAWQILMDFPANPEYYTLKRGFSTLITRLQDQVEKLGGKIHTGVNANVIHVVNKEYHVNVSVAKQGSSAYAFDPADTIETMVANGIVLAIPAQAMATLFAASPVMNINANSRQLWEDINSVQPMRLMKINLYFETPWWYDGSTGQPPIAGGPSFTDMPINSVYPFYTVRTEPGEPDAKKPAALTIYCDFTNTTFWEGLQNVGPKFDSPLQREHNDPHVLFPASEAVVAEAMRQFKILFKTHYVPRPVLTSYRLWSGANDFPHAYHQWGLNANDREVRKRMTRPLVGENIYTCNEAWSDMQGWVNGSLRSCDDMLSECFNMKPITELFKACKKFPAPPPPPVNSVSKS